MRKKTIEERRATDRERARRYRARHRGEWLETQKKLATYGQAIWQKAAVREMEKEHTVTDSVIAEQTVEYELDNSVTAASEEEARVLEWVKRKRGVEVEIE